MSGQQWASDKLARLLSARPQPRNPELMEKFESGEAITHRARQAPTGALARMVGKISQFKPRVCRAIDPITSRQRRRKWGGSSSMPDGLRGYYSEAERAALAVVAEQVKRQGFCDLPIEKIADISGVSRTTVQNAIRKARSRDRNDITVQLRPQPGRKNLTNVIRIISRDWLRWLKRSIGFKALNPSERSRESSLSKRKFDGEKAFENGEFGGRSHNRQSMSVLGRHASASPWTVAAAAPS
jgi:hypothetical protein